MTTSTILAGMVAQQHVFERSRTPVFAGRGPATMPCMTLAPSCMVVFRVYEKYLVDCFVANKHLTPPIHHSKHLQGPVEQW